MTWPAPTTPEERTVARRRDANIAVFARDIARQCVAIDRHKKIMEKIERDKPRSIATIAKRLGVSEAELLTHQTQGDEK